jgi:hypothetical protein
MAKSRSTPSPSPSPSRQYLASLGFSNGNGSPKPETDTARLVRIETLLERVQGTLETQFKRMGEMQALIDRLCADRNR